MSGQDQLTGEDPLQGLDQKTMLTREHAGPQGSRAIVPEDRYPALGEDRAPVIISIDQMDRDAGLGRPGSEYRFVDPHAVHPQSPEARQEGGVDVDDPSGVLGQGLGTELLHVAGEDHEADAVADERIADGPIQRLGLGVGLRAQMVGR